jgi:membrane protease YdiL (CAAX protease family)
MTTDKPGRDPSARVHLIGIVVVLGVEYVLRNVLIPSDPAEASILVCLTVEWLIAIGLLAYWIPRVEGEDLASVGIGRFRWRYLGVGTAAYALSMILMMIGGFALETVGMESTRVLASKVDPYGILTIVGLFLTGTIVEEVFYRGYLIERVIRVTGARWLGAGVSWLTFTFVHLRFFGIGPTLQISILSAALVLLYIRERSIWPCVVAHGLNGVFGYFLSPLLFA